MEAALNVEPVMVIESEKVLATLKVVSCQRPTGTKLNSIVAGGLSEPDAVAGGVVVEVDDVHALKRAQNAATARRRKD
jgi:hypothetical protein